MSICIICGTNCSPVKLACWNYNKKGKVVLEGYASVNCLRSQDKGITVQQEGNV
jgi:hypothetical protein